MHKTTSIIHSEHRRLAAVLNCFSAVLDDVVQRGSQADLDLFEAMLNYLKSFVFTFHHPKEDAYLFPVLRQRSADAAELIERLEADHARGAILSQELRDAFAHFREHGDEAALAAFHAAAQAYKQFEWQHMSTEERQIMPLAEKCLTQEDWVQLDAVFSDHQDPLFGDKPQAEFAGLMSEIVNRAPAPHGLGAAAPKSKPDG
jgi:branched-chain amino acid transport system ATP-binding protein